jgi:hypothetical protein
MEMIVGKGRVHSDPRGVNIIVEIRRDDTNLGGIVTLVKRLSTRMRKIGVLGSFDDHRQFYADFLEQVMVDQPLRSLDEYLRVHEIPPPLTLGSSSEVGIKEMFQSLSDNSGCLITTRGERREFSVIMTEPDPTTPREGPIRLTKAMAVEVFRRIAKRGYPASDEEVLPAVPFMMLAKSEENVIADAIGADCANGVVPLKVVRTVGRALAITKEVHDLIGGLHV